MKIITKTTKQKGGDTNFCLGRERFLKKNKTKETKNKKQKKTKKNYIT